MARIDGDDCAYCGAPPFWQDGAWVEVHQDDKRIPGFCPRCGAIVDDAGKFYGP